MNDTGTTTAYRLNPEGPARIVAPMIRAALLFALSSAILLPSAVHAQGLAVGANFGVAESFDDGFEFNLEDSLTEIWIGTETERDTELRLRAGRAETDDGVPVGGIGSVDGTVEYINALAQYNSSEIFGKSAVYLGPGYYRQKYGAQEESDWGIAAGVSALFPVTRRLGFTLDLGYHWVNFEESYDFVAATAGIRLGF